MEALRVLEELQTRVLHRIETLELSLRADRSVGCSVNGTVVRLSAILRARGVDDFAFKRVPADYYDRPLDARRDILGASSVMHLCKSIVMVNTQAPANITDCSNHNNSKYYVVVVQYAARLNAENIKNFLYTLNEGKVAKKKFNMRLAPEDESLKLTGFVHNAVTCIGMETDIPSRPIASLTVRINGLPVKAQSMRISLGEDISLLDVGSGNFSNKVILDEAITRLKPDFFWLGGGEVDLKLGMRTSQFVRAVNPFIVNCSS